jgi:uncharacterized protein (DUF1810 family)
MSTDDDGGLSRFLEAQQPVYEQVIAELWAGRKESHWMWFIFPQLRGLGFSSMAHRYGIASRQEAEEYSRHPVLGPRLLECTRLVLAVEGKSALQILGSPDEMKFSSCMTRFDAAWPEQAAFGRALVQYFNSEPDERTLELLAKF